MRNLRKFSVFLLFIAVFGVLLYSLFPAALGDMAENLRSGGGTRTFIQAVQGADGVAYALEAERGGGYSLYGASAEGRVSERPLSEGLPQDFSVVWHGGEQRPGSSTKFAKVSCGYTS